jgi:hypothetical protein
VGGDPTLARQGGGVSGPVSQAPGKPGPAPVSTSGGSLGGGSLVDPPALPSRVALDLDLAVDEGGRVYLASSRIAEPFVGEPTGVFVSVLDPRTNAWGRETLLAPRHGAEYPEKGLPTLSRVQVAASQNVVVTTWMHAEGDWEDYADVDAAFSMDGGATWSRPLGLTHKPNGAGSVRSADPQVWLMGPQAAVVWSDRRNWTDPTVAGLPLPPGSPLGAPDVYLNVLTLP